MSFTLFDFLVIVVVLISAVLAMVRGFVREVLSIVSWVAAAVAAYFLYEPLLGLINPSPISDVTIATIVSVAVVFLVVLIIATYITMKIADFVIDSRIGAVDRLLGFIFGVARGVLLAVIAFAFFTWLVPLTAQPSWIANAATTPMLENLRDSLISVLPDDIEATLVEGFRGVDEEGATAPLDPGGFDDRFAPEPAGNLDAGALERLLQPGVPQTPTPAAPVATPTP